MTFSILFPSIKEKKETQHAPVFFTDLNLDQIVDAITAGKEEYNLKPFFYTTLADTSSIQYRQEVMQDLEHSVLFEIVKSFAAKMRAMRQHLAQADKLYYKLQKQSWFLDAVEIYCDAVNSLAESLSGAELKSWGFLACREYVSSYSRFVSFASLAEETKKLKAELATVQYCILIKGDRVTVRKYNSELDYSARGRKDIREIQTGSSERLPSQVFSRAGHESYRSESPRVGQPALSGDLF